MEYDDDAGQDQEATYRGHSNGQDEQQHQADYNPQPDTTHPPTVLLTELDNGALVLQGRPDRPQVWLDPLYAVPLKRELAAAFGHTRLAAAGYDQDSAR